MNPKVGFIFICSVVMVFFKKLDSKCQGQPNEGHRDAILRISEKESFLIHFFLKILIGGTHQIYMQSR